MSLQVWLPLLGNTTNQGLSTQSFDVSNTTYITVDNAGKLGKCYSFNSSATNNGIFSADGGFMTNYINNKSWSLCAWVQTTATDTCVMSLSYGLRMYAGDSSHTFVSLYNSSRTVNCMSSVASNDGNWHHLCATYDVNTNAIKFYVDGINTGNATYTSGYTYASSWVNGLFIGRDPNNSKVNDHYLFKGRMNDVRLYDHCLSPKEIKEISKGLVCHYTLGDKLCDNILTNSTGYNGTANWNGLISQATENGIPYLIAQRTNTTSTSRTFVTHTAITSYVSSWVPGDKFTISGYYRVPSSEAYAVTANLFIRWALSTGSSSDTGFSTPSASTVVKDTWIRFEYTYTVPANYTDGAVNFYLSAFSQGLSTVHWKYVKLEKGDKATNWCPNSADAEYSIAGYDDTTIYDCSGYNYHGTNSGCTISSTTPRYSVSTAFDGSTSYIEFNNLAFMPTMLPLEWSFSFWVYNQDTGGRSVFFSNFGLGGVGSNSFGFEKTAGELLRVAYVAGTFDRNIPNSNMPADTWTHFVVTKTAAHLVSVYKNGALIDSYTNANCASSGVIYRMGRDSRSDGTMYKGGLSDFRIYATALSSDDILELYHTGASIDKDGNMYAYEYKEV